MAPVQEEHQFLWQPSSLLSCFAIGLYLLLEAHSLMDISGESIHNKASDILLTNQLLPQLRDGVLLQAETQVTYLK